MRTGRSTGKLLAIACALALVSCAKPAQRAAAPAPSGMGKIGYVRMQELLKVHPLYSQLAQTERSMEALNLRALGPETPQTGADLSKQDAQLQNELNQASLRTKKLLDQKQNEYRQQEGAAIAAALKAGGRAAPAQSIGSTVNATAQQQAAQVTAAMSKDLLAYQRALSEQDRAQSVAFARSISARADRQYRAKANELQQKESNFALELASKDAPDRLELRTRLANLALDDTAREEVRKKVAALDRTEGDQVAAMRNRDQQTLTQLRAQLQASSKREIEAGVAKIHAENQQKMMSRAGATRQAAVSQQLTVPGQAVAGGQNLPPDLKGKIDALHKQYQDKFNADAKSTIEQFNKTREELKKRYETLHGIDTAAQVSAHKELVALQAQHDKLYAQMVDQINREVRVVAQNSGVTTVISEVAGPADGVDLTPAAKKEIESLHE